MMIRHGSNIIFLEILYIISRTIFDTSSTIVKLSHVALFFRAIKSTTNDYCNANQRFLSFIKTIYQKYDSI